MVSKIVERQANVTTEFGKYQLIEKIGIGGMAEVFLAKSFGAEGIEKILVIKKILPEFSENPRFIDMFIAEAKIAMGLNHPNIVQIYDFGKVGADYYLAMEYVDGVNIGQLLRACQKSGRALSIGDAVYIGVELAKGLDYAHRRCDSYGNSLELVHRDISPQNLLVSRDGTVKIVDFGIAKATSVADETPLIVKGKFGYMSPEQASGKPVDQRSDLFSLGVVLFEMVCGRALFRPGTQEETLSLVKSAVVPDIASLNAAIPAPLEHLLYKVLSRRPEDRSATARELQVELTRVLYGLGDIFDAVSTAAHLKGVEAYLDETSTTGPTRAGSTALNTAMTSLQRGSATTAELGTRVQHVHTPITPIATELSEQGVELLARQRKEVVIIAGEVHGLLELRSTLGQDRWLQVLQEYTRIVDSIAFKNDGVIHRINENGFVILLGVPVSSENDSERAARMAMDLHEAVAGMNLSLDSPIRLALGIAIGDVLLEQEIDNGGRRYTWSFYGSSYELAERLAQSAMARESLLGGQVFRRVRRDFHCEEIDEVRVSETDGESYVVQAYRLEAPKSPRDQIQELRRSYHSFYGREIARKVLRAAYRQTLLDEAASALIIVGASGVGKSTLVEDFLSGLDSRNVRVVRGVVTPFDKDVPLGSAAALLAEMLRLGGRDDLRQLRDTLETRIKALFPDEDDTELGLLVHSMGSLFNLKSPSGRFAELDGEERRRRTFLTITKVTSRFAGKKPLILAIEDAHYIDPMTLEFLGQFFEARQGAPTFFLCTASDSGPHLEQRQWKEFAAARFVKVEPLLELSPKEAEGLVRDMLRVHMIDDEHLVSEILRCSGGNPLYIKEVIEVLGDRGLLKNKAEDLGVNTAEEEARWLPASVEGLISARIDHLALADRVALQRLALLWSPFTMADAALVFDEAVVSSDGLEQLVKLGLLHRADVPGQDPGEDAFDPEQVAAEVRLYRFCNALTQEVAGRNLVPDEATALHRTIANVLLARRDQLGLHGSALIARHFDGAGDREAAVEHYTDAAQAAFEHFGAAECVRLCDKVLERTGELDVHRLKVLKLREAALLELGHQERSHQTLEQLHDLVFEIGNASEQIDVLIRLARHHFDVSDLKTSRSFIDRAHAIAEQAEDRLGRARIWRMKAMIAMTEGHRERALELLASAIEVYRGSEGVEQTEGLAASHNLRGVILRQAGRHREALAAYEEALVHARISENGKQIRYLLLNSGLALVYLGEFTEALARYDAALEQCRRLGHRRDESALLVNIGHAHFLLGQHKSALSNLQRGIHLARKTANTAVVADGQISLGVCYLDAGDLPAAESCLHEGLRLADSIPHAYLSIHATLALAQVKLAGAARDDAKIALMQAEDAMERAEAAEMRWGATFANSLMARAQKLLGRRDAAIERSRKAVALLDQGELFAMEDVLYNHFQILPDEPAYREERLLAISRAREVVLHRRDQIPDESDRSAFMSRQINRQILSVAQLVRGQPVESE